MESKLHTVTVGLDQKFQAKCVGKHCKEKGQKQKRVLRMHNMCEALYQRFYKHLIQSSQEFCEILFSFHWKL